MKELSKNKQEDMDSIEQLIDKLIIIGIIKCLLPIVHRICAYIQTCNIVLLCDEKLKWLQRCPIAIQFSHRKSSNSLQTIWTFDKFGIRNLKLGFVWNANCTHVGG